MRSYERNQRNIPQRILLALVPLPILWYVAALPYTTMQRLVPVQAVLHECQLTRKVVEGKVHWAPPRPRVSYEFDGRKYYRIVQLQVEGDARLSQSEVADEVLALRSRLGETLTLWVDPEEPTRGYVYRRMPALRAWLWIADLKRGQFPLS